VLRFFLCLPDGAASAIFGLPTGLSPGAPDVHVLACQMEFPMKKIALAAALSLAATTAFAGGVSEPVMEEEVVAAATSSSASGIIVPILLLLVIAAAVSSSSGGGEPM